MQPLATLHLEGEATALHVTPNGQHAFAVMRRRRWELEAAARIATLCARRAAQTAPGSSSGSGSADPFLAALSERVSKEQCALVATGPSLAPFASELSACPPSALCPSFLSEQVYPALILSEGLYSPRPYAFARCEEGHFCLGGLMLRCPPGYQCPRRGMTRPQRCEPPAGSLASASSSCFDPVLLSGVVAPRPCEPDTICSVPHRPGLPVPPGFFASQPPANAADAADAADATTESTDTEMRRRFWRCEPGEWCPLGRVGTRSGAPASRGGARALTAMARAEGKEARAAGRGLMMQADLQGGNAADAGTSVVACALAQFELSLLVEGRQVTATDLHCPLASYCATPAVLTPTQCNFTLAAPAFCPAGSYEERICPAGYVCAGPSRRQPCAPSSYCPEGSVVRLSCKGGYYCPTPAQQLPCPQGHVCSPGTYADLRLHPQTSRLRTQP